MFKFEIMNRIDEDIKANSSKAVIDMI